MHNNFPIHIEKQKLKEYIFITMNFSSFKIIFMKHMKHIDIISFIFFQMHSQHLTTLP